MATKQCGNCSEMVDEAKAFCPGCGDAFVDEEQRENVSDFDKLDSTVQLGQTMYNQMLSDMGLNISKTAPPAAVPDDEAKTKISENRVEKVVSEPVQKRTEAVAQVQRRIEVIAPAATATVPVAMAPTREKSNAKWYFLGGALLVLVVALIAAALLLAYWLRFR